MFGENSCDNNEMSKLESSIYKALLMSATAHPLRRDLMGSIVLGKQQ